MNTLRLYFAVGFAGFFGSIARLLVARICGQIFNNTAFPVGTMVINLSGSLFLGWFLAMVGNRVTVSDTTKMAVAVGFVGAYTTFSTYMNESSELFKRGATIQGIVNVVGSVVLGLIAVRLGVWLAAR